MQKKLNLKVLLEGEFMPLEESKEGMLRGGFAALYTQANNCDCDTIANDCKCNGNSCNKTNSDLNTNCPCGSDNADNCKCKNYGTPVSSSSPSTSSQALFLMDLPVI